MNYQEAEAKRFLKFVDDATWALFPGVLRYNDLTEDEKATVRVFIALLHETDEVIH